MGAIRVKELYIESGVYEFRVADAGENLHVQLINQIPATVKLSTHEVTKPRQVVVRTFEVPKRGL